MQYGTTTIRYQLVFAARKTLAIQVFPDGHVQVKAPKGCALATVAQLVHKRAAWILRQQRQFRNLARPSPLPRQYVSGESYRFLGRQLRLKVVAGEGVRVHRSRHYLTITVPNPADTAHVGDVLTRWYTAQAHRVFAERLALCWPRVAVLGIAGPPPLTVRLLKTRWGSCSTKGRITLNVRLVQAPPHLIDYVLLHELCHLKEFNHSPAYYALLTRVLPDWRERRRHLNQIEMT